MSTESKRFMRIIVNGKAAGNIELRTAVGVLRERGYRIDVRVTWEAADAARMASDAVHSGVDVVIAAGGDGTVNEVVNGVVEADEPTGPAIGIVPFGTANDFATACGIPSGDVLGALTLAAEGSAVPIDVGRVNNRLFVNVASGGLGAEITSKTPVELKKLMGGAAYALMGLLTAHQLTPYHARFNAEGHEAEGELLILSIGNSRLAGGGHPVAPQALLDDGRLDLLAVHDVQPSDFRTLLDELLDLGADNRRFVHYLQVQSIELEFDREFQLNVDGEPLRDKRFAIDVLPGRVSFILPSECDLVGRSG